MVVMERAVRFEEVDAAGLVFFARIVGYGHEAMEAFFDQVEGGYAGLICQRKIGFPAVRLETDFSAPLRYGDRMRIDTDIAHLGGRSAQFRYRIYRLAADGDDVLCASLQHTVVVTDLVQLKSCPMPDDVRAALERHLVAA